jgi:maleylpyruvate isomerase
LNLKGIAYEQVAVDLRREDHLTPQYKSVNPQQLVPALDVGGRILTQTPAIIEWLEERHPSPPLLPKDPEHRARVRAFAAIVGCDVHPVNNRRILETLRKDFGAGEDAINRWCGRWITEGFDALETLIADKVDGGRYCFGDAPTLADVYLVPQVESARRFKLDMSRWPRLMSIDQACGELKEFQWAAPANQPDAT